LYDNAACTRKGVDPEWFFTVTADDDTGLTKRERAVVNVQRTRKARAVCEHCPARERCLDDNLTAPYGIYAGLNVSERQTLAVQRGVQWDAGAPTVDEIAIERAILGDETVFLDRQTRLELIRRLDAKGVAYPDIVRIARASSQTIRVARGLGCPTCGELNCTDPHPGVGKSPGSLAALKQGTVAVAV
jgi:hypothetical protein